MINKTLPWSAMIFPSLFDRYNYCMTVYSPLLSNNTGIGYREYNPVKFGVNNTQLWLANMTSLIKNDR